MTTESRLGVASDMIEPSTIAKRFECNAALNDTESENAFNPPGTSIHCAPEFL